MMPLPGLSIYKPSQRSNFQGAQTQYLAWLLCNDIMQSITLHKVSNRFNEKKKKKAGSKSTHNSLLQSKSIHIYKYASNPHLCLSYLSTGITGSCTHTWHLCGCWVWELQSSSCMQFTHWASQGYIMKSYLKKQNNQTKNKTNKKPTINDFFHICM